MANAPVEVKRTVPTRTTPTMPDIWQAFRGEMDRVFDRFGFPMMGSMFDATPFARWENPAMTAPAIDITEDAAAYKLTAELPGMTEQDIEVALRGDVLTLKGEKKEEKETDEAEMHLSERSYGAFARSFTLPEGVDADKIGAAFANGVLTLTLPKAAAAMPPAKTIEVKPAERKAAGPKPAAMKAAA
jgi:HSP20 family protein